MLVLVLIIAATSGSSHAAELNQAESSHACLVG